MAVITGGAGNDNLLGTYLADTISGLAGNDTIEGSFGNDVLLGGDGNDTFKYKPNDGTDGINGGN